MLIADLDIRVIDATPAGSSATSSSTPPATTSHRGRNPDHQKTSPEMQRCPETPVNGVPRHHMARSEGFEPPTF